MTVHFRLRSLKCSYYWDRNLKCTVTDQTKIYKALDWKVQFLLKESQIRSSNPLHGQSILNHKCSIDHFLSIQELNFMPGRECSKLSRHQSVRIGLQMASEICPININSRAVHYFWQFSFSNKN